jgi:CRP-like cAMP-binding protein
VKSAFTPATRAHLDAVPVFASLSPSERGGLLPHCRIRVHGKGETVFSEGERTTELMFVVFGSVKVVKTAGERSVVVGLLGPGDPLGIVAPLHATPYPATAVTLVPTTILQIQRRDFSGIVERHPEVTRQLLETFMVRQAEVGQRLQDMTVSVERRVARALLVLERRIGRTGPRGVEIPMPLDRQDVADLAGTTIETAIRIMSRWGKEGIVYTEGHGFRIPDLARLQMIADGGAQE